MGLGSKDAVVKVSAKATDGGKKAEDFLSKIFELTGEEVNVEATTDGDVLRVNLSGPDMGIVIGKRGETLDALQHLTSLVVNKGDGNFMKVSLDAENYREKRNEALESLAHKLANTCHHLCGKTGGKPFYIILCGLVVQNIFPELCNSPVLDAIVHFAYYGVLVYPGNFIILVGDHRVLPQVPYQKAA